MLLYLKIFLLYWGHKMEEPIKKQKAKYRSAIRSKRLIREAYVELMQQKEADKISVSDIVRLADLNRGTFYAHYTNPNDVKEEIADEIFQKINEILLDFNFTNFLTEPTPFFEKFEVILSENMKFYKEIICYTLSMDFISKVKKSLIERISTDDSVPAKVKNDPQFSILLDLFAGGMISLYTDFVQGNIDISAQQISKTLTILIIEGSKSLLKQI